jgi:hypothetical protein
MDHMRTRPIEAGAEAVLGGATGLVAGAMIRDMLKPKCEEKLCDKVMKNTCCEIKKQADLVKKVVDPTAHSLIEMGPVPGAAKAAVEAAVGVGAGKAAAEGAAIATKVAAQTASEIEQHRKDNPTTSKIERGIGYATGGPIAGGLVGTAIEVGDVKARQAYNWVKGLLK